MPDLESRRRDTRAGHSIFYLTPHLCTSRAARVAGPGSQAATTSLQRVPALLEREGRAPTTPSARAASPRRTPDEAANPNPRLECFSNSQTAFSLRARPLQGPDLWEAAASFSAAPKSGPARCLESWCPRGSTRVAGRALRGSTAGELRGFRLVFGPTCSPRRGGWFQALSSPFTLCGNPRGMPEAGHPAGVGRTRCVSSVPLPVATVQRL